MSNPQTCVALIPARAGSKRVQNKNIRALAGHPLLAYSIITAQQSGVFTEVIVSTDTQEIADIATSYGATVLSLRPAELATDTSTDIDWIQYVLAELNTAGTLADCFSILRPTSPFRTSGTIQRAWKQFQEDSSADSLRAVELCSQHPAKMWKVNGTRMQPVMASPDPTSTPWHSTPYQALPKIYVQNASLEIARCKVAIEDGTIAGNEIMPFITEGYEGFDINTELDWITAEQLLSQQPNLLPRI